MDAHRLVQRGNREMVVVGLVSGTSFGESVHVDSSVLHVIHSSGRLVSVVLDGTER